MSIPKITGQQARALLDGSQLARSGNWYDEGDAAEMLDPLAYHDVSGDAALISASVSLAETVAWLYGREPDGPTPHIHRGQTGEYDQEAVAAHPETGVVEVYAAHDHGDASAFLTPDESVDLARALLAAAEEARP